MSVSVGWLDLFVELSRPIQVLVYPPPPPEAVAQSELGVRDAPGLLVVFGGLEGVLLYIAKPDIVQPSEAVPRQRLVGRQRLNVDGGVVRVGDTNTLNGVMALLGDGRT